MNVNTRALDTALNLVGAALNVPLNSLVFALTSALDDAERRGYNEGYSHGDEDCVASALNRNENEYMNGYANGAADMQDELYDEGDDEIQQVATENYDDGYLDAVHDFGLSAEGAMKRANEIEEERVSNAANRAAWDDVEGLNLFPFDAEELQ